MHKTTVCPADFRAIFTAFSFDLLVTKISLSAITNRFELLCQSKATDATVKESLSLFVLFRPSYFCNQSSHDCLLQRVTRESLKNVGDIVLEIMYIPPGSGEPQKKMKTNSDPVSGKLLVKCIEGKNLTGTESSNPFCKL